MTRKLAIGAVTTVLLGGAGAWYAFSEAGSSAIADLDPAAFAQLKNEFNAGAGKVRVIALLSPT